MSTRPFGKTVSTFLIFALIAPSIIFLAPQKAEAFPVFDAAAFRNTTIIQIKETISAIAEVSSEIANVAMEINANVLQPLAFILSGNLLKMITAGTIQFVIGKANGTGIPQFVVDVQKSLQTVGDIRALTFLDQFGRNSNSPYRGSIISSLKNDYLSKTSLAGFWAENMDTLAASTPTYQSDYLRGNWSHGGVRAWFALTTQTQNNPYALYNRSRDQLGTLVGHGVDGVTGARKEELNWGSGFTSWCGAEDATLAETGREVGSDSAPAEGSGVNPGDPCTKKDGKAGVIKTPGSVIVTSLNKALGLQTDSILRMGNVGPEINNILKDIGTVMETVNFATQILGGLDSGGLLGAGASSGSDSSSRLSRFAPTVDQSGNFTDGYLGATEGSVEAGAAATEAARTSGKTGAASSVTVQIPVEETPVTGSGDLLSRVAQYEIAWNTIRTSANSASTSVATLINTCTTAANNTSLSTASRDAASAQAVSAQAALSSVIAPVFVNANNASTQITTARAVASSEFAAAIAASTTFPPTSSDVTSAQLNASVLGTATASPAGSLTVSGGTSVDQLNLLSTNASALKASVCSPTS